MFFIDSRKKFISFDRNLGLVHTYFNSFNVLFNEDIDEDTLFIIIVDFYWLAGEG